MDRDGAWKGWRTCQAYQTLSRRFHNLSLSENITHDDAANNINHTPWCLLLGTPRPFLLDAFNIYISALSAQTSILCVPMRVHSPDRTPIWAKHSLPPSRVLLSPSLYLVPYISPWLMCMRVINVSHFFTRLLSAHGLAAWQGWRWVSGGGGGLLTPSRRTVASRLLIQIYIPNGECVITQSCVQNFWAKLGNVLHLVMRFMWARRI